MTSTPTPEQPQRDAGERPRPPAMRGGHRGARVILLAAHPLSTMVERGPGGEASPSATSDKRDSPPAPAHRWPDTAAPG